MNRKVWLAAVIMTAIAGQANANEKDEQQSTSSGVRGEARWLDAVVVSGTASTQAETDNIDSYKAEATTATTKIATSLREIPQSITVITQERIKDQNLRTAQEYFQWIPGMGNVHNLEGFVSIRGFGAQTTINGVPSNGVSGRTHTDISAFDRIEVLKGPAGLLQGSGSPGGSINYQFKKPTHDLKIEGTLAGGSEDALNLGLDVGGPLNKSGSLRARGVLFKDKRDEYVDVEKRDRSSMYGVLEYDVTDSTVASLGYWQQKNKGVQSFRQGLPAYTDGGLLWDVDPRTSMTQDWAKWDFKATWWLADIEHYFNDNWSMKLSYRQGENDHPSFYSSPARGGCGLPAFNGIDRNDPSSSQRCFTAEYWNETNKYTDVDAFLAGRFNVLGQEQDIIFGANWERNEWERRLRGPDPAGYEFINDYFKPNPHVTDRPGVGAPTPGYAPSVTRQRGIYTRATIRFNDWLSMPIGGRYTWVSNSSGEKTASSVFTPYIGLVADLNENWTAYASYTETFNPSTARSWVGPNHIGDLIPNQDGKQVEVGVKTFWLENRLMISAAAYDLKLNNTTRSDDTPGRPRGFSINTGTQQTRGFEFDVQGKVNSQWSIGAAYAYMSAKYAKGGLYSGQYVSNAPTHSANLYTNYRFAPGSSLEGLSVGGGVRYAGKIYGSTVAKGGVRLQAPGYTTAHLRAAYQLHKHAELAVNVDNLFDKTYWRELGTVAGQNFYGVGRTWMATLRLKY